MPIAPKTAMVLAAGLGTRMRPLTLTRPKPLVEVAGKPLIDHMLDAFVAAGVQRAIVNVHYLADQLEAHLRTRRDLEVIVSDERDIVLETGGALVKARALLGDEPIFVANTDQVLAEVPGDPCLERLKARFDPDRMDGLLLLAPLAQSMGYHGAGDFDLDDQGRVRRRGERPSVPFAYSGVQILKPQAVDGFALEPFSLNRAWDRLLPDRLFGLPHESMWMHVGDPQAREDAEGYLTSRA